MSSSAVIVNYGMGNVASVKKALDYLGINCYISDNAKDLKSANYIIIPGVGSFKQGMENLKNRGLIDVLNEEVIDNEKPAMGICLGMQLFAQFGTEPQHCNGLGWIEGIVQKMEEPNVRIPHLGWNNPHFLDSSFKDFDKKDFYFIHSYHFHVSDSSKILATVEYGENKYVAAVKYKNLMATQFHPEKSQDIGLSLLKYFFKEYA